MCVSAAGEGLRKLCLAPRHRRFQDICAINEIEVQGDEFTIASMNDTCHQRNESVQVSKAASRSA